MLSFFWPTNRLGWVGMGRWIISPGTILYQHISLRTFGWKSSGWSEGWRSYDDSHNPTSEWASNDSGWKPNDRSKNSVRNSSNTTDNAWKPSDQSKSSAWNPSNTPVYTPLITTFPKCPPISPTYPPIPTPPIPPIHQCCRRRRCCGVYQP